MPELPEVECARCLIEKYCRGKTIKKIRHDKTDDFVFVNCHKEIPRFKGRTLTEVKRKGKWMWIEFDKKPYMCVHLGMTGGFRVKDVDSVQYRNTKFDTDSWPPRFWKFEMTFDDGTQLAFMNSRKLGRVRVSGDPRSEKCIAQLGFDAYTETMELERFIELTSKRKAPIKALLLNQSFTAGVGNWIADEILYHAKVHPGHRAHELSEAQIATIFEKLIFVIRTACEAGADYKKFPEEWLFHYRWTGKKETTDYHGRKIIFDKFGGRTSAIVPAIQKLKGYVAPEQKGEAKKRKAKQKQEKESKPKKRKKKGVKRQRSVSRKRKKKTKRARKTRKKTREPPALEPISDTPTRRSKRIAKRRTAKK